MTPEPLGHASVDAHDARQLISALADGEADASEVGRGCAAWADAASAGRRSWHAYHLIGDVLRSDDLASPPGRDQAFLERLRLRLADEPVAIDMASAQAVSPSADVGARRDRRTTGWAWPVALAAGVMAMATVLVIGLGPVGGSVPAAPLAAAPAAATAVATQDDPQAPLLQAAGMGSRVVRDAQLDRYLRAHRDYGTALPGSLPGGPGRSISTVSLDR